MNGSENTIDLSWKQKAYYESPAYLDAREHYFKAAHYRVLIIEGVQLK